MRQFRPDPTQVAPASVKQLTDFAAGGSSTKSLPLSDQPGQIPKDYDSAYFVAQGKLLFTEYNCYGCHAHGGGDMGPALMDGQWIYGPDPAVIFYSIAAGRPNGMPAFGTRLPAYQVWQLTAYVRSMSGLGPKDAAPGRKDSMESGAPENSRAPEQPRRAPDAEKALDQRLHRYGRGLAPGNAHIPIDKAMEIETGKFPVQAGRQ
jgi:cytochrome c oxidase cbb3-type subunit III